MQSVRYFAIKFPFILRKKGTKAVTKYTFVPKVCILAPKRYILVPKVYILVPKWYILEPF